MKKNIINYQEKWPEKTVLINNLTLDPENIRLEIENKTQDEVINDLFMNEKAMDILQSIYDNGFFPDETPVVIEENDKLVVFEGNRRIVSLQAMLKPDIAPQKYKEKIEKLMKDTQPLREVKVRIALDRDEAMVYLAAKHTKNTRRQWTALRRAYFYYAQKEKGQSINDLLTRYKEVDISSYIRMFEMHQIAMASKNISDEVRKKVTNKRNFDITTLERLYSDSYVQKKLGIEFSKLGEVTVPKSEEFNQVYSRVITDIVDKIITSRKKISDSKGRKEYIDMIVPNNISRTTILKADDFRPVEISKSKSKLDISGIKFFLPFPAVERMYNELKRINISNGVGFPNAAHDLLRSFLECALKGFFEINKIIITKTGQYTFLKDALDEFEKNTEVKKLAGDKYVALKNLVSKVKQEKGIGNMMGYTANFMNQLKHSHYFFSDRETLQDGWDNLKPLFMFILSTLPKEDEEDTKSKK